MSTLTSAKSVKWVEVGRSRCLASRVPSNTPLLGPARHHLVPRHPHPYGSCLGLCALLPQGLGRLSGGAPAPAPDLANPIPGSRGRAHLRLPDRFRVRLQAHQVGPQEAVLLVTAINRP